MYFPIMMEKRSQNSMKSTSFDLFFTQNLNNIVNILAISEWAETG